MPTTRQRTISRPVALTIAGSDSGGGAGIQADLKTFAALGVHGATAITCLTAQNPDTVTAVTETPAAMVEEQIRAVCAGFPVRAVKTGMLYSATIIMIVAQALKKQAIPFYVLDPVMIATSGARLLKDDAVETLERRLIPLATVITPNIPEAEALLGSSLSCHRDIVQGARELARRYHVAVVIKGGHLEGDTVSDTLYAGDMLTTFKLPRLRVQETHGTGCTFSAALTAGLACGASLRLAVKRAQTFVHQALAHAYRAGAHAPLGIGLR